MLARNGLNPKQDVKMILVGPTESRLAALRANAIQATIVEPPYNFLALKDGFRKLGYSGDYYRTLQGALTVSEQKLNADPDEVARFVKATLRGLHAYRDQRRLQEKGLA
jgi:ABC-type nitrate/sulfonate/bicarbonate transport system substrate-binding protein